MTTDDSIRSSAGKQKMEGHRARGHSDHCSSGGNRSRSFSDTPKQPPPTLLVQHRPSPSDQLFHTQPSLPRSPPRTVVSIRGQTLIAPNSSLARAIVMGNELSQQVNEDDWNQLTDTQRREASRGTNKKPSKPAASNLTVLLQQQQDSPNLPEHHQQVAIAAAGSSPSSASTDHTVTEADTASGPPPAPPPPPAIILGRSAPNILSRDDVQAFLRHHSAGRQAMKSYILAGSDGNNEKSLSKSPSIKCSDQQGERPRR